MTPTAVVSIPMRDGESLAADVYVPSACTSCPVVLIQTPYNKNLFRNGLPLGYFQNLESSPYAWVIVDWRGFYGSLSAAVAQPKRGEDGYDIMEWIVAQSWSNGKIGTWGPSALGSIQYLTARENHPNHTCAVPIVAHPQTFYEGYFYGGVLEKSRLEQLDALGYGLSTVVLANPYHNLTWQFSESSTWYPEDIRIPMLQIGGWYDHNIDKMMDWYEATRTLADINVRDEQWLLVGPWVHGGTGAANVGSATQGELTYVNAANKSNQTALEFFDYYLLENANGWETTPRITYYELGNNVWNTSDDAAIESASVSELFLNQNNSLSVQNSTGSSSFVSDPDNPSPTLGGPTLHPALDQGPYDQVSLEGRTDILTFSSAVLGNDVSVSGRIKLNLYVEADQPDADIAVRLVDAYPDGRNMLINDGIKRMRFRDGYKQTDEVFMSSGQVYHAEVELPFVNYTWKAGHALKIYLSGNNSTRWDVNLQNGGAMYTAGTANIANIQIHHSAVYPSKIILPGDNPLLSLKNQHHQQQIHLNPNPVKSDMKLSFEKGVQPDRYEILDLQGKVLMKEFWTSDLLDAAQLRSGFYFLRIYSEGTLIANLKFIKE